MFIMNILGEFVDITDILAPISTVLSTTFFPLSKEKNFITGKGFWKFDSCLPCNSN